MPDIIDIKHAKPILFNTEMVKALLDGRKTQTRRIVKCKWFDDQLEPIPHNAEYKGMQNGKAQFCLGIRSGAVAPPHTAGDVLYVRETWLVRKTDIGSQCDYEIEYKAGGTKRFKGIPPKQISDRWSPSIHMPKDIARLYLRIKDVRMERLQNISEENAIKEGLYKGWHRTPTSSFALTAKQAFMWVWESTVRKEDRIACSWFSNPYVWVYEFEIVD